MRAGSILRALPLALVLLSPAACPSPDEGPSDGGSGGAGGEGAGGGGGAAPACELALEGLAADGSWLALSSGQHVGVIQGFQGFVYSLVRVRAPSERIAQARTTITTSLEGGAPAPGHQGIGAYAVEGDGSVSGRLMVFFNGTPWAALVGKQVTLLAKVHAAPCDGETTATVVLDAAEERLDP